MSTTNQSFAVSVLLHRDGDAWVAQGLEYDVAAQAPSREVAMQRFLHVLTAQIVMDLNEKTEPLSQLRPAPQRYFDQLVNKTAGPELPVYVPVVDDQPRVNARARFFEDEATSHAHA